MELKEIMLTAEDEAIDAIQRTLCRRGPLPANNLRGCIANCKPHIHQVVKSTETEVLSFVRKFPSIFKVNKGVVYHTEMLQGVEVTWVRRNSKYAVCHVLARGEEVLLFAEVLTEAHALSAFNPGTSIHVDAIPLHLSSTSGEAPRWKAVKIKCSAAKKQKCRSNVQTKVNKAVAASDNSVVETPTKKPVTPEKSTKQSSTSETVSTSAKHSLPPIKSTHTGVLLTVEEYHNCLVSIRAAFKKKDRLTLSAILKALPPEVLAFVGHDEDSLMKLLQQTNNVFQEPLLKNQLSLNKIEEEKAIISETCSSWCSFAVVDKTKNKVFISKQSIINYQSSLTAGTEVIVSAHENDPREVNSTTKQPLLAKWRAYEVKVIPSAVHDKHKKSDETSGHDRDKKSAVTSSHVADKSALTSSQVVDKKPTATPADAEEEKPPLSSSQARRTKAPEASVSIERFEQSITSVKVKTPLTSVHCQTSIKMKSSTCQTECDVKSRTIACQTKTDKCEKWTQTSAEMCSASLASRSSQTTINLQSSLSLPQFHIELFQERLYEAVANIANEVFNNDMWSSLIDSDGAEGLGTERIENWLDGCSEERLYRNGKNFATESQPKSCDDDNEQFTHDLPETSFRSVLSRTPTPCAFLPDEEVRNESVDAEKLTDKQSIETQTIVTGYICPSAFYTCS